MVQLRDINAMTDQEIVQAILQRDPYVTKEYLYKKCYPLFKSIYDKYYTGCDSWIEFVNEIYLYIMIPKKAIMQANSLSLASVALSSTGLR